MNQPSSLGGTLEDIADRWTIPVARLRFAFPLNGESKSQLNWRVIVHVTSQFRTCAVNAVGSPKGLMTPMGIASNFSPWHSMASSIDEPEKQARVFPTEAVSKKKQFVH